MHDPEVTMDYFTLFGLPASYT
ncbi:co-chaperone HscB, partial [Acinetobacter baumannii]|nr:co-chaperone HscB [Acinetobacter baumannii]